MTAIAEAPGLVLPGGSSIPGADTNHTRLASATGRRIVELVRQDVRPRSLLTARTADNAIRVHMAMGGSTNAMIHFVAKARRASVPLGLDRFDAIAREVPVLADVRPSGRYLMEDFYYVGGILALVKRLAPLLDLDCPTIDGCTLGAVLEGVKVHNPEIIRSLAEPVARQACAILHGNLAPEGAVIEPSAAEPRLLRHEGPAIAFEDYDEMTARIDDPALELTPDHILVLEDAGPVGGPACRNGACCRSPRSSSRPACATWCGSRTRACPAPLAAPASRS